MFSAFSAPVLRALAGQPYLGAQLYKTAVKAMNNKESRKVFMLQVGFVSKIDKFGQYGKRALARPA